MVPSIGYILLWLSLFLAIFQFIIPFKKNFIRLNQFHKIATSGILLCTASSFFILMYSHIISDFSLLNVFQNSHTTKPLFYKITGVWGNHEGSMLLWILVLAIVNYLINKLHNTSNGLFIINTLQVQSVIIIGFLIFTLFTSNPFERIIPSQLNGLGFNPILQDPALAIHPPLLYLGYVGFSAAFSMSIAAMNLNNNNNIPWYKYMKTFVLMAWIFLTVGITFGSIWAYYELGWGGWWFWDPVENAAFMPWLLGTALLHSLISVEKKKSLQSWVLLLAILCFLLSVTGTFLVRSGVLTSVHTFALDPSRGIYILAFIALMGGYSLILFALKSKYFLSEHFFTFFSKEGAIFANNLLMSIICASVFFGTIYPLFIEIIADKRISVGEPYFNATIIPLIIPAILIMGISLILPWGKSNSDKILKKLVLSILGTIIVTVLILLFFQLKNFLGLIGIALVSWVMSNTLVSIIYLVTSKLNKVKDINIRNTSLSMIIAHFGVGVMILGITGSSVWQEEKITQMKVNDKTVIKNYNIVFKEIIKIEGANYYAIQGNFWIYNKKNQIITTLKPENRFYPATNNSTTEASIHTNLLRDLYIVIGDGNINDGWVVRIYYNPLVIWIWIGVAIIFIGGLFALRKNLNTLEHSK